MKIEPTNPFYKIEYDPIVFKEILPKFKKSKLIRGIRHRISFHMDECRYGIRSAEKRWGVDIVFFEAGHGPVKNIWIDSAVFDKIAVIWREEIKKDKQFMNRITKELSEIISEEIKLSEVIPHKDFSDKVLKEYMLLRLEKMNKFFEFYMTFLAAEKLVQEEKIKKNWAGDEKSLRNFMAGVFKPTKLPPTSIEQRDLIKLVPLEGKEFEIQLREHWKKYCFMSAHMIGDQIFDIDYYRNRVDALKKNKAEYEKTKESLMLVEDELKQSTNLLDKAPLPVELKESITFVREVFYLITTAIEYLLLVNNAYTPIFSSLSKVFGLPMDVALNMTYKEIIDSLEAGKLTISTEMIFERAKGYAYLITPPKSFLVTGKEIDELQSFVIQEEKQKELKILKGQTAFEGKVEGTARIILDSRNASELKEGEILVVPMTNPEFVPAMKISSGIITNEGGILCHAAIMSREFRKPCVIGTKIATDVIKTGQRIVLDADNGKIILG